MEHFDFVILGGGAAAFAAATEADRLNIKTAMVNTGLPMGGTCVNVGCVPTKYLLAVGEELHRISHPRFESIKTEKVSFDFSKTMKGLKDLLSGLRKSNYIDVLKGFKNVTYIEGKGSFVTDKIIKVGEREIRASQILIATGCRTKVPPLEGLDVAGYITNREALSLDKLPDSIIIFGGGPMGLEFAQIFSRFGVRVTLLEVKDRLLSMTEPEISEAIKGYLEGEGIKIVTGIKMRRVESGGVNKSVIIEQNGEEERVTGDEILVATGVRGNIEDLNLEVAGIEVEKGCNVRVNECLQTNIPHVWAAGDVVCHICLETVAAKEGKMVVENAFKRVKRRVDFLSIPFAVFTDPEVAGVGMTESQYMERYGTCDCRTVYLEQVPKALAVKDTRGLIKIVAHHETGRIIGVHILAPHASEMIHEATLTVRFGLTIDDVIDTTHVFPTFSEAIKIASQAYRRDVKSMSCCVE